MFDERKVSQAAAFFLWQFGGRMSHLKLMKLLYLADREAMRAFGTPISGDDYYSLPHGPVLSQTKDLMDGYCKSTKGGWDDWITDKENHEVALRETAVDRDLLDELSDAEIKVLHAVWEKFKHFTRWQIRDYTHSANIPEWENPCGSSKPLPVEKILRAVGRSVEQIQDDLAHLHGKQRVNALFSRLSA